MYYRYEISKSSDNSNRNKSIAVSVLKISALVSILCGILLYSRVYLIIPLIVVGVILGVVALTISSSVGRSTYVEIYVVNEDELIITHKFSDGREKEILREKLEKITLSEYRIVGDYLEYDARIGEQVRGIKSNRYLYYALEKK